MIFHEDCPVVLTQTFQAGLFCVVGVDNEFKRYIFAVVTVRGHDQLTAFNFCRRLPVAKGMRQCDGT